MPQVRPPCKEAVTEHQKSSLAELPNRRKYSLYEDINLYNRTRYFEISTYPITKKAEDDMELISDLITWGEMYRHVYDPGTYHCARCLNLVYDNKDKWNGPCVWPSFRRPANAETSLQYDEVAPYNKYTITVKEVYCQKCLLFIGHAFDDGIVKGDKHPEAQWRH